ncbi:MFS general substrate transporter [Lepidopterella palustris CBS 459.81]|uniref:MFS general substrate transporter n=1 Tax=Lepidopterella palustris CBS 459.81 TaxID=1314670 RepID=A0A8E2EK04_9PEZI|nr:MFS general substrate transporter [Lepidopterella palustris CBS 459.81]
MKAKRGERPDCFSSTVQEVLFVLTVTMAVGMSSFTIGSVTVITSFVGKDLNMTNAEITWISAAASLSSGSLLLFFGSVADLFGRKALFISSMGLFAVFSLAAGFSKTGLTLDILSGVMGIMSASAVPPAQGILGVIYEKPSKRKNRVFACFSAGNPLGFVFGSIFSGVATQLFSWRASFWLLAIIYLLSTIVALFTVPNDTSVKQPFTWETLKKFDIVGTVLTIAGIGMFSASLSLGGDAPDGWKTPYVLVLLILGILAIVAFIIWENKFQYAMIPMNIWRDRDFTLLLSIMLLGFLAFPILAFWISLYMQRILHFSALETAVHLLPMAIMGIVVNIIAAMVLHKVSNKLLMGIGACAYVVSFLLAAVQRHGDSYWAFTFPALCLCVLGADFEFNVANMYVLSALPPTRQSIAGSLFQTVTKLCVAVGYGIATAIFNGVAKNPAKSGYYNGDPFEPYAATFWFSTAVASVGVLLVPWLRIGTQGHETRGGDRNEEEGDERANIGAEVDEKGVGRVAGVEVGDGNDHADVEKGMHSAGDADEKHGDAGGRLEKEKEEFDVL